MNIPIPEGWVRVEEGTTCSGDLVWNAENLKFEGVDCINEYVGIYHSVIRTKEADDAEIAARGALNPPRVKSDRSTIKTLAVRYVIARDTVRKAKRERRKNRCTEFSNGSVMDGDPGVCECWRDGGSKDDWCDACREAQVHHLAAVEGMKEVQRIWRKLRAEVLVSEGRAL